MGNSTPNTGQLDANTSNRTRDPTRNNRGTQTMACRNDNSTNGRPLRAAKEQAAVGWDLALEGCMS